ncbi:uncharacterized protein DUF2752 [Thermosporothrix hazakensis]|uniref:Uncharacterized protein DUF2752 n=2 Tax=Thermosporothrix TaxID=768650 RepID=A0A326TT03_THEHA|nr:DUF2752 domain-containing protein [Thermosporothrix hazakensis]PZW19523.1 uncharacterized protein DUF2752 [Thermosporothrix hazakensis]BBH89383.1 hypothetical protein KTC_41340 [Thermosporothrix sp. COM3]GCE47566.1 hypothetical protein KTH_24350 [Thermosporothrix hazakensis]
MKHTIPSRATGKVVGYLLLPLLFWLIPSSWLEAHPIPCLSRLLLHRTCPGCGMTRAVSCTIHGEFRKAWHYNKRVVFVFPLLLLVWGKGFQHAWSDFVRHLYRR